MDYRFYLTTVKNKKDAETIAGELLRYKLAACVSVIDKMTSMYVWKNEICSESECQMIIKSTVQNYENIKKVVLSLHKYDLPEFVEIPVTNGSEDYLNWISGSVR